MKIVIAPDSFKESLTAKEVADAIENGWRQIYPHANIVKVPMADGGEGTVQALVDATEGYIVQKKVTGPLGKEVAGFFGILGDGKTAVIEMAAAAGLHYVPIHERNPLLTTTKGVGELIIAALDEGVEKIIIGLGGSATNDGGAGMAQALGIRLLNSDGKEISSGGDLINLHQINLDNIDPRLENVSFEVACDVDNPLTGERGASVVFGLQKGATKEQIALLDRGLSHYAKMIKEGIEKDIEFVAGAGAAGGLGAGLLAFLNANLRSGVDIVVAATGLEQKLIDADLVITGEGRIDFQTISGKTPIGVAKVAKREGISVVGIAGCLGKDSHIVHEHGIDAVFPIVPGIISLEKALETGAINVERTVRNVAMAMKQAESVFK